MNRRLREEMAAHMEELVREYRARGMDEQAARRAARVRLGGVDQIEEAWREQRGWQWFEDLRRDLGLGWRALRKSPGFTLVVVLSLALGIGANAAIFSVLDAALLRQLPVRDPGQLAVLYWHARQWPPALDQSGAGSPPEVTESGSYSLAYPTYQQLRDHGGAVLSDLFGFAPLGIGANRTGITVDSQTTLAKGVLVTGGFFRGLGVPAYRGRTILPADEEPGAALAAVLSYGYWKKQFARDPGLIGKQVAINGNPATIVGIAPPGFFGVQPGQSVDLWIGMSPSTPASLAPWGSSPPNTTVYASTNYWWLQVMARLNPGISRERASAELGPLFRQLALSGLSPAPTGDAIPQLGMAVGDQGINNFRADNGQTLYILMSVVGLLLLLACVNVAALLLARATARRQEIGVRLALGARRSRLVRQLLTESVLLACIGGGVGAALAPLGTRLLLLMMGGTSPLPLAVHADGAVVAFTAGVSGLTGILFGLAPAFRCTKVEIGAVLKSGRQGGGRVRLRGDKALAMVQVALSLVMLVGAGLFLHTLTQLEGQPLGFNPDHLLVFGLDGSQAGYKGASLVALYGHVRERLTAVPGVEAVTASRLGLLTGWVSNGSVSVPGVKLSGSAARSEFNGVGAGFFASMGIPMRLGHDFTEPDLASSRHVGIVNETLARHLFGKAYPLGRQVVDGDITYDIIGVAGDARYAEVQGQMPATLYYPYTQMDGPLASLVFEVRLRGGTEAVLPGIRAALHQIDPALAMASVQTMQQVRSDQFQQPRMFAQLSGFFGLLGVLLACIGLEGTMAYAVARRTGEIGIRMALGAGRGQVVMSVLREAVVVTVAGVALGVAGAYAAARVIASQLYGVKPTDPMTLIAAAALMLGVAGLAGGWPARRAARVDPVVALRAE